MPPGMQGRERERERGEEGGEEEEEGKQSSLRPEDLGKTPFVTSAPMSVFFEASSTASSASHVLICGSPSFNPPFSSLNARVCLSMVDMSLLNDFSRLKRRESGTASYCEHQSAYD